MKSANIKKLYYFNYNELYQLKKKQVLFNYMPVKLWCSDVLKFYIKQNQIEKLYNHIIEAEFLKIYNKIDLKSIRIRKKFIKDLHHIEFDSDKELIDNFKTNYIKE